MKNAERKMSLTMLIMDGSPRSAAYLSLSRRKLRTSLRLKSPQRRAFEISADYKVYTDSSAYGDLLDGGADVVVTRENPTSPEMV